MAPDCLFFFFIFCKYQFQSLIFNVTYVSCLIISSFGDLKNEINYLQNRNMLDVYSGNITEKPNPLAFCYHLFQCIIIFFFCLFSLCAALHCVCLAEGKSLTAVIHLHE